MGRNWGNEYKERNNYKIIKVEVPESYKNEYVDACHMLGISQTEPLRKAIEETINKVKTQNKEDN